MKQKGRIICDIDIDIYNRFKLATIYSRYKKSNTIIENALSDFLNKIEKENKPEMEKLFNNVDENMPDDMFKNEIKEYKSLDEKQNIQ